MPEDDVRIEGLIARLAAIIKEMDTTRDLRHFNTLWGERAELVTAILAQPLGDAALTCLLDDPDPIVQFEAARDCLSKQISREAALKTLQSLASRSDRMGEKAQSHLAKWEIDPDGTIYPAGSRDLPFLPPPPGCGRLRAEEMIKAAFAPERSPAIIDLLRPAIRIWPRKPRTGDGSRFGGLPVAPARWKWPVVEEEPLVFLAQINCAELGPLAASFGLPSQSVLSFFAGRGDIDGIPTHGGVVFNFPDHKKLRVHSPPSGAAAPLISCDMSFYESFELPHPSSAAVEAIGIRHLGNDTQWDRTEWDAYFDLYTAVAQFGWDENQRHGENDISKLFGWPDLVQDEIHSGGTQLLLQLGKYHDGKEWLGWGSGGHVYFTIRPSDLAAGQFTNAMLDVQMT